MGRGRAKTKKRKQSPPQSTRRDDVASDGHAIEGGNAAGRPIETELAHAEIADAKPAVSDEGSDVFADAIPSADVSSVGETDGVAINVERDQVKPADTAGKKILGFVNFDGRSGDGNASRFLIDDAYLEEFRRGSYVEVESKRDGKRYLGRLVEGPYFSPDYVGIESSIARLAIQKAPIISALPDFHAAGVIEVLGQFASNGQIRGFSTRPFPQSIVYTVDGEGLTELLHLDGELRLGRLDGYEEVTVNFAHDQKRVLPRNIGIFGTVGSGKTNTSQVLIEEAARLGWAVVVLDVEGEYVEMGLPTTEMPMIARLRELRLNPEGIKDFSVYHPVSVDDDADDSVPSEPFAITFGSLNPYMVAELLGMNDTQEDRFLQVYDACVRNPTAPQHQIAKSKSKKGSTAKSIIQPLEEDDDEPAPDAEALSNRFGASIVDLLDEDEHRNVTLQMLIERIDKWIAETIDDSQRKITFPTSWNRVRNQLMRLLRMRLFDTEAKPLDAQTMLSAGRVSVINLSDSLEPRVNNLAIADVLGRIFKYKLEHQDPHVLIVIEEAHTFVSKENVRRMEATMERLREIARRGRKRWLSLAFISQQPSHLPAELYELCNNLFVHETKGQKNLDALKGSAGAINEGIWHDVPTLGQGRAIVVSPQFKHPVITRMNPSRCKRRMTD